ncbi:MAG TPA: relaxase domain-containing protein [Candidatus Aquilonibacter sp.]|nr:relaxase domain-containing protein [Candidatus Aquilonibacter sp.]
MSAFLESAIDGDFYGTSLAGGVNDEGTVFKVTTNGTQQFATAIYQSELTYRLRQLGYEITTGRSGAPEIKGYTQEYLDASSPRSRQIREYLERTGRSGKEAAEIAAHSTRDRKEIHSLKEVMAAHRKLAADFGHQADAVVRVARERSQHQEKPVNSFDRVRESLTFSRTRGKSCSSRMKLRVRRRS